LKMSSAQTAAILFGHNVLTAWAELDPC